MAPEVEAAVVELAIEEPAWGQVRVANELAKRYQQTFIDTYAKVGFAKLYDRKTRLTAADLLNDRVLPFYEVHEILLNGCSPIAGPSTAACRITTSTSCTWRWRTSTTRGPRRGARRRMESASGS